MYHTPEFQAMVVLISSPLASAVTLWGMREHASSSKQQPDSRLKHQPHSSSATAASDTQATSTDDEVTHTDATL
jgi:hypothetical protein